MKCAAERTIGQKRDRHRIESPILQRLVQGRLARIDHHLLLIQHQHVDAGPGAAHADLGHQIIHRIGARGDQHVPFFQDRRQAIDIDVIRIDQHLAGGERHEAAVDMHWLRADRRDFVDAKAAWRQIAPQPLNAGEVGDIAARDKQIIAAAHEIGSVEHRLKFIDNVTDRLALLGDGVIRIEQLIRQLRPGGGCPAGAGVEVFLEQRAISITLQLAAAPAGRGFDDLIADHHVAVARACDAEAG